MKKVLAASVILLVFSLSSTVQAFDRHPRQEVLSQLPADKQTLFHQTMGQAWEGTKDIRDQSKDLKVEINGILTAPEFNEAIFLEKSQTLHDLHKTMAAAMDKAFAEVAKQCSPEERAILAQVSPGRRGHHGRSSESSAP